MQRISLVCRYQGDPEAYYLHGLHPTEKAAQPQTFTECIGNYLTADGDFDVAGKNWAWALKWAGHAGAMGMYPPSDLGLLFHVLVRAI